MRPESELDRSPVGAEPSLLSREPQMLAAMLESFDDAVILVDAGWRVSYWNAAAERLTGVHRTEVLGVRLWDRFVALADTALAVIAREAMDHRRAGEMRGWEFGGGNGGAIARHDVRCFPVERHGIAMVFAPAHRRTASDAESAERAAANEVRSNFLATISHELRTPLTALTGYSELLVDQVLGTLSRSQLDIVERMRVVTHHLTVMIDELLTYSAIEGGRATAALRETSVGEMLGAALAVIEPLASQRGLSLVCQMPDPGPRLTTDPDKVTQILVNLASNAVKFSEHGTVTLAHEHAVGEVRLAVRDTGIGIAPEGLARLFQPFSQLDSGLTRRHGGTGLGLFISHRLAAIIGGRLEVESEVGRGSTFTLILPAEAPPP